MNKQSAVIALLLLLSVNVAHATPPGGCTGTAQYLNGRLLGYTLTANDPAVGRWLGFGFGIASSSKTPTSGAMQLYIEPNGRYTGVSLGRDGAEPLIDPVTFYGRVYCLAKDTVYVAWNDTGRAKGNSYAVVLSPDHGSISINGFIADTSPDRGMHEINGMHRVPDDLNIDTVLEYYYDLQTF